MNNPNLELITNTVNSGDGEELLNLLEKFIKSGNQTLCRELLTQLLVKEDLDDIFFQQDRHFVKNILRGKDWTSYDHLSFGDIVREFKTREILHETLNLSNQKANRLFNYLYFLSS